MVKNEKIFAIKFAIKYAYKIRFAHTIMKFVSFIITLLNLSKLGF